MNRPLLISDDTELVDDVLRLSSAHGVDLHLEPDPESARARWPRAPMVLVGADAADAVVAARLARRRDVVLVTRGASEQAWRDAVALGAEHVAALPEAERWLIDRLADCDEGPPRAGRIVAVLGSGGGAGASTFAGTLGVVAASRGLRSLLVDADPTAGGLDVLLGIEDAPGIRWPDLLESRGRIGAEALRDALPQCQGASVLSWGRQGPATMPAETIGAVLEAGSRGFDLVVVDLARQIDPTAESVLARAHEAVIVASGHVRSLAAAARLAALVGDRAASTSVILRGDARLDDAILGALGAPVLARLPARPRAVAHADEGEPPSVRDAYAKACLAVLRALAGEEAA
ncbi:MAG: hypothetical protein Q7V58_12075 [Actinomycetota bacterium]|nr:hypothetical protein [Actinomycetota bacterium]